MKKTYNFCDRKLTIAFLFAALMTLCTQRTWAECTLQTFSNYSVMLEGSNQLRLKFPLYSKLNSDCWIAEGTIYIQIDGSDSKEVIFHCESETDIAGSDYNPWMKCYKGVDGTMRLFRQRGYSTTTIGTTSSKVNCPCKENSDDAFVDLLWDVPKKYRGKKVTISWSMRHNGNSPEPNKWLAIDATSINMSDAPDVQAPMIMDPIISFDAGKPNQIVVPYMIATNDVKTMKAHYKEIIGNIYFEKTVNLGNSASDFVWLTTDNPIHDFYLEATYTDSEGTEQTSVSPSIDVPVLHQPYGLGAVLNPDGTVVLTWGINHPRWDDISPSDTWEIQRNVSGSSEANNGQWVTIGQVDYDDQETEYTYTDNTLLSAYKGNNVYYRVRRVITSIWGWSDWTGWAMSELTATIALPTVAQATVHRAGEWSDSKHEVAIDFSVGASSQYDSQERFVIRNADDWATFAQLVNKGQTSLNAIMAADIDLGTNLVRVGDSSSHAYNGTFDGNGHVLNFSPDTLDVECAAPFAYVGTATFRNLHLTGSICSRRKFAAGLVGQVLRGKTLTIERCHSTVTVGSSISGDATNGGFVGAVMEDAFINMKNCLFDGRLTGDDSSCNGGLVGWCWYKATLENCLFAPAEITTSMKDCRTFVRMQSESRLKLVNSYFTVPYGGNQYDSQGRFIIYHADDWNTFLDLVKEAKGSNINAVLGGDISVSTMVGSESAPYQGNFDGNGHTISVSISSDQTYTALFQHIKNATFNNLTVKGNVSGGRHTAGLVGRAVGTNTIQNCRVSTNITTSDRYAGGFIGHGTSAKNIIHYCLFDGSATNTGAFNDDTYVGAFIGWEDGGTSNEVSANLENGRYYNFSHPGANYKYTDPHNWGGTNNWSMNDWNECNKAKGKSAAQLIQALGSSKWTSDDEGNVLPVLTTTDVGQGSSAFGMDKPQLAMALGEDWVLSGNAVLPVMTISEEQDHKTIVWDPLAKLVLDIEKTVGNEVKYTEQMELTEEERQGGHLQIDLTSSCVDHQFRFRVDPRNSTLPLLDTLGVEVKKTDAGELAIYRFDSNAKLSSLKADTMQNAVSLSWETDGGVVDFYRILRYDKLEPDKVETLESEYTQTVYIDRTVRPQHNYVYTIQGVTLCEGEHVSEISREGCCEPTGMVRGYVRLANGIGLPGVTVTATPVDANVGNVVSCVTDSAGYFEIGGLLYQGAGQYTLTIPGAEPKSVQFDDDYNLFTNINFYQQNYFTFSGFVLYEGSSIPVAGVRFLRDGQPVMNASGKAVTTNNQGAFEVSVPQGTHSIQVVKEGHVFKNDGYYIDLDKEEGDQRDHNWQKDLSDIYLWDQTKVKLQGRVVGGNDQGLLPLGQSLSKNNLGKDVTMVFQLEGDNTSWIVRDQLDPTVTDLHYPHSHGKDGQDTTRVDAYRHRIEVHPDPNTGEYEVPFYPVKYKVTEIYAQGYPTLFQTGMVSETVDLTTYADGDTATYSRIYHATPKLDVWQFNGTSDRYYGLKRYISRDNAGINDTIVLWDNGKYALGHPVFMAGASVPLVLSAREEYYYNNESLGELDIVQLNGGRVIAGNGLVADNQTDEIELDSLGEGTYVFVPMNTTFTQEDDLALRTLKFTLEYDGSYYDCQPLQAYIMAVKPKSEGRHITVGKNAHLVDILRDPPGANSSAYIEQGSKFSYSYTANLTVTGGVKLNVGLGSGSDFYVGMWAGVTPPAGGTAFGSTAGTTTTSTNYGSLSYTLGTTYYEDWAYNYEFETKDRISTSSNPLDVGMDADVYIGMVDDVIMEDAIAVRVVNSSALQRLMPGMGGKTIVNGHEYNVNGSAKVLARGWDATNGDSVYLVRDDVIQAYNQTNSTFAYSQAYILNTIIPDLIKTRNSMVLDYTTDSTYAQALADKSKQPVYVSLVAADNPLFATADTLYTRYVPTGMDDQWNDTIQSINNLIETWVGFIAANEKEKLEVNNGNLLKVYDFDGITNISHNESFATSEGLHRYWRLPVSIDVGGPGKGTGYQKTPGDYRYTQDNQGVINSVDYVGGGLKVSFSIAPLFGFDFNYMNGKSEAYSKSSGFNLVCSRTSNLSVGVYLAKEISADSISKLQEAGDLGVFYKNVESNIKDIYNGKLGTNTNSYLNGTGSAKRYRNFVYRTLGGATCSPYENERRTLFYRPGTVLDQKTVDIDQLRIWADQPSVSNVPYGEPARFTIYLANESPMPELTNRIFRFYLDDKSNPKGAKLYIDGAAVTRDGIMVWLNPGDVVEKKLEVYAGAEYDYENLVLGFCNPDDITRVHRVNISAHFVPSAGKINISKPGDKWVVNTESAYDKDLQAYYLPVHIDGFDVNYRNFDHIELQYKLSNQGDKEWVNVCSYYRNNDEGKELMARASGERKLMDSDGFIDANFYGETDPVEQYYDLRAVTFCRHDGGYLTSSSNILTGIKDTRRPQPFGTPQPTNGILGIGDDIKIAFSEQIAGNYLSSVNNFEVLGTTNTTSISLSTALQFDGKGLAMSVSKRNLADKDFTLDLMLKPKHNGKDMTVLYQGDEETSYLKLGVTSAGELSVDISGNVVKSETAVDFTEIRQVAYVFDVDDEKNETKVVFYEGNTVIGEGTLKGIYTGQGRLTFGSDYEGEMLETRLWNKAMTAAELATYSMKRLTGYELGLIDNYPMNEGRGTYCYDKAVGSNDLELRGVTWRSPEGISMKLDGEKGIRLASDNFNRLNYHDYTLMFWFRTNDANGTLMANGEARDELDNKNHFNIGFENGELFFRSGGQQVNTRGYFHDGAWHHLAVTVNRSRNVGNIYVDQSLIQSFPVDTLGGISGNNLYLGATYTDARTATKQLTGNIDEVAMFEMEITENGLKTFSNQTPTGEEMGLLAYLSFSRSEKQEDNSQRLMPTGISLKKYKDNHGKVVEGHCDTIVSPDVIEQYADRSMYAPMTDGGKLENIKYSFVADGKDLLINLDVPDYQIEKTNVFIIVKEVADLQGNLMASPLTMNLYVYRNPLHWNVKRKQVDVEYGQETTFELAIENLSGKTQKFTLEGLPDWMTVSRKSGSISALDEAFVTMTISPYVNVGDYEEIIYIVGENGTTEPLPINVKVRGEAPQWAVDEQLKASSNVMYMVARVNLGSEIARESDDMLSAVGKGHRILGTAHVDTDPKTESNDGLVYLTIYNTSDADEHTPLTFEFYDASSNRIFVVEKKIDADVALIPDTIYFKADTVLGSASAPINLYSGFKEVQSLQLEKGWNWVSSYIQPAKAKMSDLMNSFGTWEVGDGIEILKDDGSYELLTYKAVYDPKTYTEKYYWDHGDQAYQLSVQRMYRIYVHNDKTIYWSGDNYSYVGVPVHKGWNRISYLSFMNLPLTTALSDYTEMAQVGDIIKTQSEFAVLNIDKSGNRSWKGTLKYMRTGEGYMLKRGADDDVQFYYPYYSSGTIYNNSASQQVAERTPLYLNNTGSSMCVIAQVDGFDLKEGDKLVAISGAETRGVAEADEEGLFFLSVADTDDGRVGFAIERDGEIVATTAQQMNYVDNGVTGTLNQPTVISFIPFDATESEGWYSLQGIKLNDKPVQKGVFIHNGQKVVVK